MLNPDYGWTKCWILTRAELYSKSWLGLNFMLNTDYTVGLIFCWILISAELYTESWLRLNCSVKMVVVKLKHVLLRLYLKLSSKSFVLAIKQYNLMVLVCFFIGWDPQVRWLSYLLGQWSPLLMTKMVFAFGEMGWK